ncbi:siroheme decarboxylase subunit beta [Achromobacter aegrifaciens]|uniref:siroheme decarboxylase subunit beta n=1 Tax=Achromobacter aegrifaciens TaxID=1287736 RepID=UPI00278CC95A|nr:AsnC family transcriptional regulator [Achromobacter aegrifaciens]MDQ1758573.1 AsnC family transcriptional regulator [Achromobacter aegrifaciens]
MASELSDSDLRLLDGWQRDFPLVSRPYALLAERVGLDEDTVLARFQRWQREGLVSRVGPVLHQSCFASALVGMHVPSARLDQVAAYVSSLPQVNHNYEREHALNLWFVAACRKPGALARLLARIAQASGCEPLALPMEAEYHIDLGFSLSAPQQRTTPQRSGGRAVLPPAGSAQETLLHAVQDGLDLCAHPYRRLGLLAGLDEDETLRLLERWQRAGLFRRFGVVLRHRQLGFRANAMCVWNVDDTRVDALGQRLGAEPGVTLCYRRTRRLPQWPYNLFCMIHGKERKAVRALRNAIAGRLGLDAWPHAVLFSTRCFKQRGARFVPEEATHG